MTRDRSPDDALMQVLAQRDEYHEWADRLADALAKHIGVDIGEHSNLNNPWQTALEWLAAPLQQAGEPAGWKLVPAKPTAEMVAAGIAEAQAGGYGENIYAAMLAAAPLQQASKATQP